MKQYFKQIGDQLFKIYYKGYEDGFRGKPKAIPKMSLNYIEKLILEMDAEDRQRDFNSAKLLAKAKQRVLNGDNIEVIFEDLEKCLIAGFEFNPKAKELIANHPQEDE